MVFTFFHQFSVLRINNVVLSRLQKVSATDTSELRNTGGYFDCRFTWRITFLFPWNCSMWKCWHSLHLNKKSKDVIQFLHCSWFFKLAYFLFLSLTVMFNSWFYFISKYLYWVDSKVFYPSNTYWACFSLGSENLHVEACNGLLCWLKVMSSCSVCLDKIWILVT